MKLNFGIALKMQRSFFIMLLRSEIGIPDKSASALVSYLLISHELEGRLGCDFDDIDAVAPP